jgi:cell division protein FtsA
MAMREEIVASLDLGTSSIKCVVGCKHGKEEVDVIGTGTAPSNGLRDGLVASRSEVVASIRAAVEEAEMMAGCDIREVYASISGRHIESFNSDGMVRIADGQVGTEDVAGVIDVAQAVRIPPDKEVLHVVPREYLIDGERAGQRPLGMPGVRLEVRAHLVIGAATSVAAIESCCRDAGLRVEDVILSSLAQAEALLTPQAKELGVVLVDVGGGTTDIAVFQGGTIVHSAVIPVGGEHITADVHDCLHTPTVEAERLKQAHGCALANLVEDHEEVDVPGAGGRKPRVIKRKLLCEIIEARVDEIFKMVQGDLEEAGFVDGLPGGVVLTGGTANMAGMSELAEQVLSMPAVQGQPHGVEGLVDVVRNPRYATGTGLVLCGAHDRSRAWFGQRGRRPAPRGWSRAFSWLPFVGR